jgi:nucleotide-binding universal stress UspA family protein
MLPIKNILVPIDFSTYSEYALNYAKELAQPIGATLHLVHVLEPINTYGTWEGLPMADLTGKAIQESEQKLQKMTADLLTEGLTVRMKVMEGHPDIALNSYATDHNIDIISMGTHGRRGLEYILFGSTTEKVLHTAPCSVLAVRMPKNSAEPHQVK